MKRHSFSQRPSAFTLVEVLVIRALLSLLLFMAVPGLKGTTASSKLGQTADQFVQHMAIARQTAIKENTPVEVRLYKYNNTGIAGNKVNSYSAWQMYRKRQDMNDPTNYSLPLVNIPVLENIAKVGTGIALADSKRWSSLVDDDSIDKGRELIRGLVPGVRETEAEYKSFIIAPDGSTNLDRSGVKQWYVTFVDDLELRKSNSPEEMKPSNFVTIQIDPYTAGTRWFQP